MYLIGDRLTVTGFRLAGMKGKNVATADESTVASELGKVPETENMILLTSTLSERAPREIEKLRRKGTTVIIIPDLRSGHEDITNQMVKDAVGFDLSK